MGLKGHGGVTRNEKTRGRVSHRSGQRRYSVERGVISNGIRGREVEEVGAAAGTLRSMTSEPPVD